ncbi:MAG: TVP38/TMEM64 family protein [Bacteroidetes bacterium]|nr:TVP38/TMEM64 family protein [Bacteroidota bacterium]
MNKIKFSLDKFLKTVLIIFVYALFVFLFWYGFRTGFIKEFISESKFLAPVIYMFVASLKAMFPVVPGEVLVGLGAFFFGPIWGLVYAVIGLTLGSVSAFSLSRKYGKKFVKNLMGKQKFEKVDKLSGDKTFFTFFLIYLTPGTPDDFVTYIAGLTSLPILKFITICVIGRLPSYIIYIVGGYSLATLNVKLLFSLWFLMFLFVGLILFVKLIIDKKASNSATNKN